MTLAGDIQADTEAIIVEWSEVFAVNRLSTTYDAERKPVESYVSQASFAGDFQPAMAELMRAEAGLQYRSEGIIYTAVSEDVQANDQITDSEGTVWYVNRIDKWEDHWVVYLRRTQGQTT